jgi:hypothetical protein
MRILLFSEKEKINQMVTEALENTSHQANTVDLSILTGMKDFSEFDIMVTDKKTWQRCAAVFKYFGILNSINDKPLMILVNDSKARSLKLREMQRKTEFYFLPFKTEDLLFSLENLLNVPSEAGNE